MVALRFRLVRWATYLVIGLIACASTPIDAQALLPTEARLAIAGDSITEQKLYTKFMEAYLVACAGRSDVSVFQFGWGGETARGFAARLSNDLADFHPTVVTTCYGMNDGGYRVYEDTIGASYEQFMRATVAGLKEMGVQTIVLGSPGAVDTKFFRTGQKWGEVGAAVGYNENLRQLRNIAEKLAKELNLTFADVHTPMIEAMAKAKAALGEDYDVCGRDGVHPGPNGHLLMAYAFLKALGCDGNIGTIEVDMNDGATCSEGHKVLSASGGKVEIESLRYPFCLEGDEKSSAGTRSIAPFCRFNQDLNRFILKVKHLTAEKAKVTWGTETREFTRAELETGVNLPAAFPRTPFDTAFSNVLQAVAVKQGYETNMIKGVITQFRFLNSEFPDDAEVKSAIGVLRQRLMKRRTLLEDKVRTAVVPIKHTIIIEAAQ